MARLSGPLASRLGVVFRHVSSRPYVCWERAPVDVTEARYGYAEYIQHDNVVWPFDDDRPKSGEILTDARFAEPMLPKQLLAAVKTRHEMRFFGLSLLLTARNPRLLLRFVLRILPGLR